MVSVPEMAGAMKALLGETARRLGRETTFVERASKLDGAGFAQTCVLGWGEHPDASLSQLSQSAASLGVAITPQGLDQRFDQEAGCLLRKLLEGASRLAWGADPAALPVLARFSAVPVQDSTTIQLPDAFAAWQGCGDAISQHLAALKVQVRLDLLLVAAVLLKPSFAVRALLRAAERVRAPIESGDLPAARSAITVSAIPFGRLIRPTSPAPCRS